MTSSVTPSTPFFLIDRARLQRNLDRIRWLREASGAKVMLALKCFSTWALFEQLQGALDGTVTSSLHEVRLGHDRFGGETLGYSVAWRDDEFDEAARLSDKLVFNSLGQWERFRSRVGARPVGLRVNPRVSTSDYDRADPARRFSRLGEWDLPRILDALPAFSGLMFHYNCDNADFRLFDEQLQHIEQRFGEALRAVDWVSLGGGVLFTQPDYPLERFAARLKGFQERWGVQVYLEPGTAVVKGAATLETTVLDLMENEMSLAVVDACVEMHMLDLMTYGLSATVEPDDGPHRYRVYGRSCVAGDVFGDFRFPQALRVGDRISFQDAAVYSLTKLSWFNGMNKPAVAIREWDGSVRTVREFGYDDFVASLS
jgi:carboxynorspermidine decarboxylase